MRNNSAYQAALSNWYTFIWTKQKTEFFHLIPRATNVYLKRVKWLSLFSIPVLLVITVSLASEYLTKFGNKKSLMMLMWNQALSSHCKNMIIIQLRIQYNEQNEQSGSEQNLQNLVLNNSSKLLMGHSHYSACDVVQKLSTTSVTVWGQSWQWKTALKIKCVI